MISAVPSTVPSPASDPAPSGSATPTAPATPVATGAPGSRDLADLVPEPLLSTVLDLGFVRPTPVQEQAIPPLLAGRDIIGVAQTGTGKTAAFGLPLLARLTDRRGVQALVLVPTRELALQVADALTSFARGLGVAVTAVYGGAPFLPQKRALDAGAQVVVGTPGRVLDHLDRGTLRLADVGLVVLDEADEMLRMGFAEDVDRILTATPPNRQVALFSATMPPAIAAVANRHLREPVRVTVARQATTAAGVRQRYVVVPHRNKVEALVRVLGVADADATLVFTRTRAGAEETGAALVARGIPAATLSGDVAQKDRERIVERLRSGALDVVVATDVAARGLDVDRIGLVVNLDLPTEPESYVHRIGRTGRAGRAGEALTFVTPGERGRLRAIERTTRVALEETTLPTREQVVRHRVERLCAAAPTPDALALAAVRELVAQGQDPEALAASLLTAALGEIPEIAAPAPREHRERGDHRERRDHRASGDHVPRQRYRVAVGRTHGARPEHIVGAMTKEGGLRGADLGKIDIFGSFSLVEIAGDIAPETFRRIGGARVAGRPLRIALDRGPRRGERRP